MTLEPGKPNDEQLQQKEVLIPKNTTRALGMGLNQLLRGQLEQIRPFIESLKGDPQVNQRYRQVIESFTDRILGLVDNFQHAKEAWIIPSSDFWDFSFSKEKETEKPPIQPQITIDDTTTPSLRQLNDAMQHNFNNGFAGLMGNLEQTESLIQDATIKKRAEEAISRTQSAYDALNPILKASYQLNISTNASGITTITPIPGPPAQSDMPS